MQPCDQEMRIRQMELDLAVAKSDIKNVKDDIKEVKDDMKDIKRGMKTMDAKMDIKFDKQLWWVVGTLATIVGSMSYIIYSNLRG